jgi:hypothetical protein
VDVGGAIAEPTTDNDFFYLCPECDYDLGEDFSNMTEDSCPECDHPIEKSSLTRGSANTAIRLRGFDEDDEDDEIPDIEDEGQEIIIEGYTSGIETYNSFRLPYGYQWSDVESWSMSGETIFIEFTSGLSWNNSLVIVNNECESTGDYRALDDQYDVLGEY